MFVAKTEMMDGLRIVGLDSFLNLCKLCFIRLWRGRPAKWAVVIHSSFFGFQIATIAHCLHAACKKRRLIFFKREQPRANGALVVSRPLAALREQHQSIPRCHAALASSYAPPEFPLLPAEGLPGQLLLARAADLRISCLRPVASRPVDLQAEQSWPGGQWAQRQKSSLPFLGRGGALCYPEAPRRWRFGGRAARLLQHPACCRQAKHAFPSTLVSGLAHFSVRSSEKDHCIRGP